MFIIAGIIPDENSPLIYGQVKLLENFLNIQNYSIPIERGTSALIAAAIKTLEVFQKEYPFIYLVGDIGKGEGSKKLYESLGENIKIHKPKVITFHYILPDVDGCLKVILGLEKLNPKPILIADAGFMYVVKMAGYSTFFDLFTPDLGELAFLADEKAPHPFYTRGFLLENENNIEDLVERAYKYENASKYLLIKGKRDYIVCQGNILKIIDNPLVEELEAIGGTGDTLTGIVSSLIYIGFSLEEACEIGAKVNRLAGALANPTPATQIGEIVNYIPKALKNLLF